MTTDPIRIVVEWAEVAGTSLKTLVSTRIARDRMPSGFENTAPSLVVQLLAMSSEMDADVQDGRYMFRCYGGTADATACWSVFRAVYARFHNKTGQTTNGGIVLSEYETGSLNWEPDTGWPVYLATFRIRTTG